MGVPCPCITVHETVVLIGLRTQAFKVTSVIQFQKIAQMI